MDLKKYLRHTKKELSFVSYSELLDMAYEYKEAYKRIMHDKKEYKNSLELKVDFLVKKVEELTIKIDTNRNFEKLYNKVKLRKLTMKERFYGRIIEKND